MQTDSNGDNLHKTSNLVFREMQEKYFKMLSGENFTLSAKSYTNLPKESEENIDKTSCHSGKAGSHFYNHNTTTMTCLKHRMRNIYYKC